MTHPFASEHYQKLAQDARALVRQWVTESQSIKPTYRCQATGWCFERPKGSALYRWICRWRHSP